MGSSGPDEIEAEKNTRPWAKLGILLFDICHQNQMLVIDLPSTQVGKGRDFNVVVFFRTEEAPDF